MLVYLVAKTIYFTSDKPHYPYELPEGWARTTLGDVCCIKGGKRLPKGMTFSKEKTNHVYLRVTDMKDNTINLSDLKYIDDEVYEQIKNYIINANDLYLTIAGTIGSVGFVPTEVDGMNLTENAAKLTHIGCNKEYLLYALLSTIAQEHFTYRFHQVAQPKLSIETANKTPIALPPQKEQIRIVEEVKRCFAAIKIIEDKQNDLEATISQAKTKILNLAIHGKLVPQDPTDEPACELLKRIDPKAEIISDNGHYQKNEQFEIPSTWVLCKLGAVNEIARGGSPRPIKDYLTNDANGINWIKIGDTTKDGKYINSVKEKIRPEGVKKSRLVHKGDFLLTNSMSYGRPYILNVDGCIHDGWLVISPIGKAYTSDFLYYLLSSSFAYEQFTNVASGGVVTNLNSDKVADTIFPLPPYTEQERIVTKIEEIFAQLDAIEASL